ncbi:MAG: hypothetical protein KAS67_02545, partial [Thermoplasmata archaeon]|nr:hypothetical protein [Thermoplasmata archaeon]
MVMMMIVAPLAALPLAVGGAESPDETPLAGGSGTIGDPYLIETVTELQGINGDLSAHYRLKNDIDATETSTWNWNGTAFNGFSPMGSFSGTFDGNGFKITNLYINRPATDRIGLFGSTNPACEIRNVSLVDFYITGYSFVGGLVGENAGKVSNCSVDGELSGYDYNGGLVGYDNYGEVFYCSSSANVSSTFNAAGGLVGQVSGLVSSSYATGYVTGDLSVGGIVGRIQDGTVELSYATGDVNGGSYVGGHTGRTHAGLNDCYSTGNVSGNMRVGGFIGWCDGNVDSSYSTGNVTGTTDIGGFAGFNSNTVTNSFWDNETSGWTILGDGTGLNTTDMMNNFTFTNAGWDFDNVWFSVNGSTRPFLRMEWNTNVSNSHQLQLMVMNLSANYTLANDIDLSDIVELGEMWGTNVTSGGGFLHVGSSPDRFNGTLEGNGHAVSGLFINRPSTNNIGLFGYTNSNAVIKNISLVGSYTSGDWYAGGLVGYNTGTVINCNVSGNSFGNTLYLGGLMGWNTGTVINCTSYSYVSGEWLGGLIGINYGTVTNCTSYSNVSGVDVLGGLIGQNYGGTVTDCISYGTVTAVGSSDMIGGLIAWNRGGTITNCIAYGTASGQRKIGGLMGQISHVSVISNCQAYGDSYASISQSGGLIGYQSAGTISQSTAYGTAYGPTDVGGLIGYVMGGAMISNCSAIGGANGGAGGDRMGGLVGWLSAGSVKNCYSTGNATGDDSIGGLIGQNSATAINCYSSGYVNGNTNFGGLIGLGPGTVTNCTWDNQTSQQVVSAEGGTGNNTANMMNNFTFKNAGWDFDNIWFSVNGSTRPFLRMEYDT